MTFKDYQDEVRKCAIQALEDAYDFDSNAKFDDVFDELCINDNVTGNGNTTQAAENTADLILDKDFCEQAEIYDYHDFMDIFTNPEELDVLARCFALDTLYTELEGVWNIMKEMDNND